MIKSGTPGLNKLCVTFENVKDDKNTKKGTDPFYVFCLVLVKKIAIKDFVDQTRLLSTLSKEEGKKYLISKISDGSDFTSNDIEIDELKLEILDPIST